MTMRHFWAQNGPFRPNKFLFLGNCYCLSHLPIRPFPCAKFKRNSSSGSRDMRMCNFWVQNGPFPQMRIFSENFSTRLVSFIHAYLNAKYQILMIKEYWYFIGREPFLSLTWELDFPQACSLHSMLINHKNFDFTQIPGKTNDLLKNSKNHVFGPFSTIFARWRFFRKHPAVTHNYIWAPKIMLSFSKN